jgi:DNA-binding NarL/FixJ family response regulator
MKAPKIAELMGISVGTVKVYASRVYSFCGVKGRVELKQREIGRLRDEVTALRSEISAK